MLGRRAVFWTTVGLVGGVVTPFLLEVAADRLPWVGLKKYVAYSHRGSA